MKPQYYRRGKVCISIARLHHAGKHTFSASNVYITRAPSTVRERTNRQSIHSHPSPTSIVGNPFRRPTRSRSKDQLIAGLSLRVALVVSHFTSHFCTCLTSRSLSRLPFDSLSHLLSASCRTMFFI